ncbi:MAG: ABC transporter ATP-binding protein [Thermoplasmata archaeon]
MTTLEIRGVSKFWGGNRALNNVSMNIEEGITGIVGPNGAGKTTLVNVVAGQVHPTSGQVLYMGEDITSLPPYKRARMGIVKTFQVVRPFRSLTIVENLELFSRVRGKSDVEKILNMTGLSDLRERTPTELPFGVLKKLEIAKALAANPDVLLLDEPFGGLGGEDIEKLSNIIKGLREQGKCIVVIEHKIWALVRLVDRIILLDRGEKKFEGNASDFIKNEKIGEFYFGGIADA